MALKYQQRASFGGYCYLIARKKSPVAVAVAVAVAVGSISLLSLALNSLVACVVLARSDGCGGQWSSPPANLLSLPLSASFSPPELLCMKRNSVCVCEFRLNCLSWLCCMRHSVILYTRGFLQFKLRIYFSPIDITAHQLLQYLIYMLRSLFLLFTS